MIYTILLFDLDGTLTNPKEGITKSVQAGLAAVGINAADAEELTSFIGPPLADSFRDQYGLGPEEIETAIRGFRARFERVGLFENEVLPGTAEMLADLKQHGRRLAIASSKPEPFVKRILEHYELAQYFETAVGATMDEKHCAKSDMIAEALRRLHVSEKERSQVLMIGDRRHDVEGAAQQGLPCLGIYSGFGPEGELEEAGAIHVVQTIPEMHAWLMQEETV